MKTPIFHEFTTCSALYSDIIILEILKIFQDYVHQVAAGHNNKFTVKIFFIAGCWEEAEKLC